MFSPRQIVLKRFDGVRPSESGWVVGNDASFWLRIPWVFGVETIIQDANWEGPVEIGAEVVTLDNGASDGGRWRFAAKKPA